MLTERWTGTFTAALTSHNNQNQETTQKSIYKGLVLQWNTIKQWEWPIHNSIQHEWNYTWHWAEAARHTQNIIYDPTYTVSTDRDLAGEPGGGAVCWLQGGPREDSGVIACVLFLALSADYMGVSFWSHWTVYLWFVYLSTCTLYFNKKFTETTNNRQIKPWWQNSE